MSFYRNREKNATIREERLQVGLGISEGCFIFDFVSLLCGGRRAHLAYHVHKGGRKTPINHHLEASLFGVLKANNRTQVTSVDYLRLELCGHAFWSP